MLDDIVEAAERMIEFTAGIAWERLGDERMRSSAILFSIIILGEAAKRVPVEVQMHYPAVPWAAMAQTRDRIVHHYEGVDWFIVGDIAHNELPLLLDEFRRIRDDLRAEFDRPRSP